MKKIKEYRRDLQKEVRIAFADGGEWGDRWEQWETILRQYGEDVREECAKIVEPVDDVLANVIRQNVKIE